MPMVPFSACTLSSSFSSQIAMCIHLCTKACNAHHRRILLQCKRWYIDVSTMKARIGPCFSVQRCRRRRPSFSRQTFGRFVRNLFQRRDKDNEAEEKRNKARGGATEQSKRGSVGQEQGSKRFAWTQGFGGQRETLSSCVRARALHIRADSLSGKGRLVVASVKL